MDVFDRNGVRVGAIFTPGDDALAKAIAPLVLIGFCAWWVWNFLSGWQSLQFPYRYIAAYYYYILVIPLKWFASIWHFCSTATSYSNINLVMGVVGVALYGMGLPVMIGVFFGVLQLLKIQRYWSVIVFGPALVGVLLFAGGSAINWLFAK